MSSNTRGIIVKSQNSPDMRTVIQHLSLCYCHKCFSQCQHYLLSPKDNRSYCKSTNFGVLLYLANLANCVFSLIFVAPTYVNYVDRTLHRRGDAKFNSRQITLFWEMPNFIATKICWFTVSNFSLFLAISACHRQTITPNKLLFSRGRGGGGGGGSYFFTESH